MTTRGFWGSLAEILIGALLGLVFGMLLLEWVAGCGETYIDATGTRHHYECVFTAMGEMMEKIIKYSEIL